MFRMFCAQIQLLKIDSIIAFKREGAASPLHSEACPWRQGAAGLSDSLRGAVSLGGPGYLDTVAAAFMAGAEFGQQGEHFRREAGHTSWTGSHCCLAG